MFTPVSEVAWKLSLQSSICAFRKEHSKYHLDQQRCHCEEYIWGFILILLRLKIYSKKKPFLTCFRYWCRDLKNFEITFSSYFLDYSPYSQCPFATSPQIWGKIENYIHKYFTMILTYNIWMKKEVDICQTVLLWHYQLTNYLQSILYKYIFIW